MVDARAFPISTQGSKKRPTQRSFDVSDVITTSWSSREEVKDASLTAFSIQSVLLPSQFMSLLYSSV